MSNRAFILLGLLLLAGCSQSGPPSTMTNSSGFVTVVDRTKFLDEHVSFRRNYQTLDLDILYQNSGCGEAFLCYRFGIINGRPFAEVVREGS